MTSFTIQLSYGQIFTKKYEENQNQINWPEEFNPSKSKFYVYNEIEIEAAAEKVWEILIEAETWPEWYIGAKNVKIIDDSTGTLKDNSAFNWETMGFEFKSVIKEFIPNSRLSWQSYKKGIPGYHAWLIVPTENGCKLITAESQNGWITILEKVFQPNKLLKLHNIWLQEIKKKAENKLAKLSTSEKIKMTSILQDTFDKFNNTIINLTEDQLNFKIANNEWSIADCIEHITLAEMEFPKIVSEEMKKDANPEKRTKIRISDERIREKMTSRSWKAKSPSVFKPSQTFNNSKEALQAFKVQRLATINYVNTTNDDLRNHFWKHPLTGVIDLYQTLLLMSAHLERHIEQIENIKKTSGFPYA